MRVAPASGTHRYAVVAADRGDNLSSSSPELASSKFAELTAALNKANLITVMLESPNVSA